MEPAAAVEHDPSKSTALKRQERLVYAYVGALVVAGVALASAVGPLLGVALALAGHLLVHAPVFAMRAEMTMWADRPPGDVAAELVAPRRNPLTSLWLEKADLVSEPAGRYDPAARFTTSGPFGVGRRRYVVDVDERADGDLRLAIRRDATVLSARITVEPADGGTAVVVDADRLRVHAFSLFVMWALESAIARHFAALGYERVDEVASLRLRLPVGR